MFAATSDNEKIKHVYGNYNLWSWLKYWYIDTYNIVNFIMIDKGFFDYDFEPTAKIIRMEDTVKSEEEVVSLMQKFGIGTTAEASSAEKLQLLAMGEQAEVKP